MLEIKITIDPLNLNKAAIYETIKYLAGFIDVKDVDNRFDFFREDSTPVKSKIKRVTKAETLEAVGPQPFEMPMPVMPTLAPVLAPVVASVSIQEPLKDIASVMERATPLMAENKLTAKQLLEIIHSIDPSVVHVRDLVNYPVVAAKVCSVLDAWAL